eukprot:347171-Chlamydomonas_euryale.AAC.1
MCHVGDGELWGAIPERPDRRTGVGKCGAGGYELRGKGICIMWEVASCGAPFLSGRADAQVWGSVAG